MMKKPSPIFRKFMRILYLGTDPSRYRCNGTLIHYPIIQTVPIATLEPQVITLWPQITHVLLTSPFAARHWLRLSPPGKKTLLAIGEATASFCPDSIIAPTATQEGMIELLKDIKDAYFLWPKSAQARTVLSDYLRPFRHHSFNLYSTVTKPVAPIDLSTIDEIVFTSPSTVRAFLEIFGSIPQDKVITPIGPITALTLEKQF
jgi:uroporphyrinogen-III synthase